MKQQSDALEKFYPLIGKVIVRFQALDSFLNVVLMGITKEQPDVVMAYSASLSFGKKVDVLKSVMLFKVGNSALLARLEDVVKALSDAEEERNRIVHASWMGGTDGTVLFHKPQTSRKRGLRNGGVRESCVEDIEGSLIIINDAVVHLSKLARELHRTGVSRIKFHKD